MKLPKAILNQKIKDLGLIDENGKPISFNKFKQLVDIHQYGRGKNKLFILFIGKPKENLLAMYPSTDIQLNMLKESYDFLLDTIMTDDKKIYMAEDVQWGNCGIPIGYGRLRAEF